MTSVGPPEWATATLMATEDGPLVDSDLKLMPLRRAPVHLASPPMTELVASRVLDQKPLKNLPRPSIKRTGLCLFHMGRAHTDLAPGPAWVSDALSRRASG